MCEHLRRMRCATLLPRRLSTARCASGRPAREVLLFKFLNGLGGESPPNPIQNGGNNDGIPPCSLGMTPVVVSAVLD